MDGTARAIFSFPILSSWCANFDRENW